MKANGIVSDSDYRKAKFMINNIASFAPEKSQAALAIMRTAEKIIMLYHMQNRGIAPATEIRNPAHIIGTHQQNETIFFAARAAKRKTK